MKILDIYIIKKFFVTFFFAITMLIAIVIVFDVSEKIDDFIDGEAPLKAIVLDYYCNFIPYFIILFAPLFVFIAVIFFTSRMAVNTEIIAILGSGISFYRLLVPYMIAASILSAFIFYANHYIVPIANKKRIAFENTYIKNPYINPNRHIHMQLDDDMYLYVQNYNNRIDEGYKFSLEKIKTGRLYNKLRGDRIVWDSLHQRWNIFNYTIRVYDRQQEHIFEGARLDTALQFTPDDFSKKLDIIEAMTTRELKKVIAEEKKKGSDKISFYQIKYFERTSYPFSTFILVVLGVAIASKKQRGGTGLQLALGIAIGFSFVFFIRIFTTYSTNANLDPLLGVWIPNILYAVFAAFLLRIAAK